MSADKRAVHTDALATLGTAPLNASEARDAIHLAVEPVIAKTRLHPGARIGIVIEKGVTYATTRAEHVGIVDPFLGRPVEKGERFWLIVNPRMITSLRHVWEHPSFPQSSDVAPVEIDSPTKEATARLTDFADSLDLTLNELIHSAYEWKKYGVYLIDGGRYEGEYVYGEFWEDLAVIDRRFDGQDHGNFFSCSC